MVISWHQPFELTLSQIGDQHKHLRGLIDLKEKWFPTKQCRNLNIFNSYHEKYLKWMKVEICNIDIQRGQAEVIQMTEKKNKEVSGKFTDLIQLHPDPVLLVLWDKYGEIKEQKYPQRDAWRKRRVGKKTKIAFLTVNAQRPLSRWDTIYIQNINTYINAFTYQGNKPTNMTFYITNDALSNLQNEVNIAWFILFDLKITQTWKLYNTKRWEYERFDQ